MIEQYKINKAFIAWNNENLSKPGVQWDDDSFKAGVQWGKGQISENLMSIINLDGDEYTDGEILDKIYEYLDRDNDD